MALGAGGNGFSAPGDGIVAGAAKQVAGRRQRAAGGPLKGILDRQHAGGVKGRDGPRTFVDGKESGQDGEGGPSLPGSWAPLESVRERGALLRPVAGGQGAAVHTLSSVALASRAALLMATQRKERHTEIRSDGIDGTLGDGRDVSTAARDEVSMGLLVGDAAARREALFRTSTGHEQFIAQGKDASGSQAPLATAIGRPAITGQLRVLASGMSGVRGSRGDEQLDPLEDGAGEGEGKESSEFRPAGEAVPSGRRDPAPIELGPDGKPVGILVDDSAVTRKLPRPPSRPGLKPLPSIRTDTEKGKGGPSVPASTSAANLSALEKGGLRTASVPGMPSDVGRSQSMKGIAHRPRSTTGRQGLGFQFGGNQGGPVSGAAAAASAADDPVPSDAEAASSFYSSDSDGPREGLDSREPVVVEEPQDVKAARLAMVSMGLKRVESFEPPMAPRDIRVVEVGHDFLRLEWQPPAFDGGSPVYDYIIRYAMVKPETEEERRKRKRKERRMRSAGEVVADAGP